MIDPADARLAAALRTLRERGVLDEDDAIAADAERTAELIALAEKIRARHR